MMRTDRIRQPAGPQAPRLRLLTDAAIEAREREREEQLARVARLLVSDPNLGITHVHIHGPRYDETFSARADNADDIVTPEAPAERAPAGAERGWLRAVRARFGGRRAR